jgi:hypothetical protein
MECVWKKKSAAWSRGLKIDGKQGAKSEGLSEKRIATSGFSLKSGKKQRNRRAEALPSLLGGGSEKKMAVEKRPGLKIEKEIPCQLINVGRLHQSGGAKRTLVAVNDVEDVFNRIFAVEEFVTFRDHGHFIKSVFKDFAKMQDM